MIQAAGTSSETIKPTKVNPMPGAAEVATRMKMQFNKNPKPQMHPCIKIFFILFWLPPVILVPLLIAVSLIAYTRKPTAITREIPEMMAAYAIDTARCIKNILVCLQINIGERENVG